MKFVYQIKDPLVLEISGRDAPRYLHNRLSNQIKELPVGRWTYAAALSPQGKTEGFFKIFRDVGTSPSGERFIVVCDGGEHAEVTAALLRYKVADRVEVKDISQSAFLFSFADIDLPLQKLTDVIDVASNQQLLDDIGAAVSQSLSTILKAEIPDLGKNSTEFQLIAQNNFWLISSKTNRLATSINISQTKGPIDSPEQDVLIVYDKPDEATPASKILEDLVAQGWSGLPFQIQKFLRILAGIPSFPSELNAKTLFSESDLMYAVSFRKGCYVGQEVIEKIDAHGKLAKRLARVLISGPIKLNEGEIVFNNTEKVGKVYSSAYVEGISLSTETPTTTLAFCSIDADIEVGTQVQISSYSATIF